MAEATKEREAPVDEKESSLTQLPQAMEGRQLLVHLTTNEGVALRVDRWSWTKMKAMIKLFFEGFKGKGDDEVSALFQGETADIASNLFAVLQDRVFTVVRESVRPEDRKYVVPEMDAEDVFNLFEATLSVNEGFIDSIKKKGPMLLRRFGLDSLFKKLVKAKK